MLTVHTLGQLADHGIRRAGVACGVFDGVHRGHQEVIRRLLGGCAEHRATPVVLTFEPHPRAILTPDAAPPRLTLPEQKLHILASYGIEAAVVVAFDRGVSQLSPQAFLDRFLLHETVELAALCVGRDWRFGRAAAGNVQFLERIGREIGFDVFPVDELYKDGSEVGSRSIRRALASGDLTSANDQLGREYVVAGHVCPGKGLGSEVFSCPTANIAPQGQMLPADGVYAVYGHLDTPAEVIAGFPPRSNIPGIAYIGTSPTIDPVRRDSILEVHLFDFDETIYGRTLAIRFVRRIREDRRFPSLKELTGQMQTDIAYARRVLRALPHGESSD